MAGIQHLFKRLSHGFSRIPGPRSGRPHPPLQFPHIQGEPIEQACKFLCKGPICSIITTQVNAEPFFPPLETGPFQQPHNGFSLRRLLTVGHHKMKVVKPVLITHAPKRLALQSKRFTIRLTQITTRTSQIRPLGIKSIFKLISADQPAVFVRLKIRGSHHHGIGKPGCGNLRQTSCQPIYNIVFRAMISFRQSLYPEFIVSQFVRMDRGQWMNPDHILINIIHPH